MASMYRTELFKGPLMRISYANGLFVPRANDSGKEKYSCALIVPRTDLGVAKLQKAVAGVVENQWGEKGVERFKKGLIKNPILAGDGKEAHDKDGNLRSGLGAEFIFIRPSSGIRPKVFNAQVLPATEDECLSGYWGYPVLNAFAWHNPQNGDGISFGINMFQVVKADEVLGGAGGGDPDQFFDKVDTSGDDDGGATTGGAGAGGLFD